MKQVYILAIIFSIPFVGFAQDREADSLTIVSIYQSLDGDNWNSNNNWLSDLPIEEWSGVGVSGDRITSLAIKSNTSSGGEGDFPLQVLDLTELQTLEIQSINISQPIPASLINLSKLQRLVLQSCNLNGDLPQIFDQFPNLTTLVLTGNELTGPLPALPHNMFLVYIGRNQFSGTIPEKWSGNEMFALELHENNLTGNYDILTTFPTIGKINVSKNDWDESTLPTWLDDIPNLQRFACDGCNLIGEIPAEMNFSSSENYNGMFLSDNKLSGDVSLLFNNSEYGQKLYLRVRSNDFKGELPVHKMESFHELDIYNNHYSSMTDPQEGFIYRINTQYNEFTYDGLAPIQHHIASDSTITVTYSPQNRIGLEDTIIINSATTLTLTSGDNHPATVYQWYKSGQEIEGENNSELVIDITDNSSSGWYRCEMTNPDFPQLNLQTHAVTLEVDISTTTNNTTFDNIVIAPNPVSDYLSISGIDNNAYYYEIKSITGKTINGKIYRGNINVSQLNAGLYILSVSNGSDTITKKFLKL